MIFIDPAWYMIHLLYLWISLWKPILFLNVQVKFIKTFLQAVGELCNGNKMVCIVNHKGNVHGKKFLMIIISSFSSCVPLLSQFRKSVGPYPVVYKYNGDVVITLYIATSKTIAQLSKRPFSVFLNLKTLWFEEWSVLDTAIMWMATPRKQVTNRPFIAAFSHVNAF